MNPCTRTNRAHPHACLLATALAAVLFSLGCAQSPRRELASRFYPDLTDGITDPIPYEVVHEETSDAPIKSQILRHVVIPLETPEAGFRALLMDQFRQAMTLPFKYHPHPTSVHIFLFDTREKAMTGRELSIAALHFLPDDQEPEIEVNRERIALLRQDPEDRLGLSEERRQEFYWALQDAKKQARAKAQGQHEETLEWALFERDLVDQYMRDVTRRYGLTEDQMIEIEMEGSRKGWLEPRFE